MNLLIRNVFPPLRDIIYPQVCFLCNTPLRNGEAKVCATCWKSFTQIDSVPPAETKHKNELQAAGYIHDLLSCYLFEQGGKLQDVVHLLKYQAMTSLGVRLGRDIGIKILGNERFSRADYLIPVPLHKAKLRERGYNQSELICKGISEVTKIPIATDCIRRTRHTQTQTHLSLEERKQNVSGAFMVVTKHQNLLNGITVILVDDVITTGSTINECAKIILGGGVERVFAASAAIV